MSQALMDSDGEEETAPAAHSVTTGRKSSFGVLGGGRRRSSGMGMGMGRRLSGFGGGSSYGDAADQAKLADMYSQVIKLSTENKINAKNSWSLTLIDHMDRMLTDTENGRSRVNFTKASCTLDASIKIYSYRVDETAASTYRVLENLNRTGNDKENREPEGGDSDGGDDEEEGGGKAKRSKVGSKGTSAKMCVSDTLEKNVNNLNIAEGEAGFDVDPLFLKLSKTFDASGSSGMLLNTLNVGKEGCAIGFDFDHSGEDGSKVDDKNQTENATADSEAPASVDVTALRTKLTSLLGGCDLANVPLCPQLEGFREELRHLMDDGSKSTSQVPPLVQNDRNSYMPDSPAEPDSVDSSHIADTNTQNEGENTHAHEDYDNGGGDWDDDNDNDNTYEGNNDSVAGINSLPPPAFASDTLDTGIWGGETQGDVQNRSATAGGDSLLLWGDSKMLEDEYAFFDRRVLQSSSSSANNWAGSTHWKFGKQNPKTLKPAIKSAAGGDPDYEDTVTAKGTKKRRRAPVEIDFDAPPVPRTALASAAVLGKRGTKKAAADPTSLTALQLQKAATAAQEEAYRLPKDLHFTAKDLARLFLRPTAIVAGLLSTTQAEGAAGESGEGSGNQACWGKPDGAASCVYDDDRGNNGWNDYEGGGGGDNGDDNSDNDDSGPGFHFNGGIIDDDLEVEGLLQASRVVEKISVGYATKAKKVDIRRLKRDMWDHIDKDRKAADQAKSEVLDENNKGENPAEEELNKTSSNEATAELRFSSVMQNVAIKQGQSEVTVSYYFICLLHLANEKGLELEGRADLTDFGIVSGTKMVST